MHSYERMYMAATIAAGLVSTHGVDHGGVSPAVVAERALAIADAIRAKSADDLNPLIESQIRAIEKRVAELDQIHPIDAPAPPTESGDAGSQTTLNDGGICLGVKPDGSVSPDETNDDGGICSAMYPDEQ